MMDEYDAHISVIGDTGKIKTIADYISKNYEVKLLQIDESEIQVWYEPGSSFDDDFAYSEENLEETCIDMSEDLCINVTVDDFEI